MAVECFVTKAIARYFEFDKRGASFPAELRGAAATFLTMAYILVANPAILSNAGIPFTSAVVGTAAASGICCLLMGLYANFPIALACGMGLNAVIAYQVVGLTGSWQTAMGLVVLDGAVVLVLVLCGLRESVMYAIPRDLRLAIGAGIGFFIAFIGAVNARMIVVPAGTLAVLSKNPVATMPPVTFGSLVNPEPAIAVFGLILTAYLLARRVKGALVLGILACTAVALLGKVARWPSVFTPPKFDIFLQADVRGALQPKYWGLLLAFVMVDFFDTLGTVTAIAEQGGLQDGRGRIFGLRRILIVDSLSAAIGGLFGVSSVTAYIESAAGVSEGARTGLHSVLVGLMFLLCIFLAPLAAVVPPAATAPALILVGFLMCAQITQINFRDYDTAIPAFVTIITLPLTYSISHGIGYGFITYVAVKILSLKFREVHPLMYAVTAAFALYFVYA